MESSDSFCFGPLKLYEVACIVSYLTAEEKFLFINTLNKKCNTYIHSSYFWKILP